jgi:hypothetical protein
MREGHQAMPLFIEPAVPQEMTMFVDHVCRILFLLTFAVLSTQCRAQIHVSPFGNDANPGTQDKPVQTLSRAAALARSAMQRASGDISVLLAGGTYRLTQPLELGPKDSGTNNHYLIFTAESNQHPVVSGGVQITGWKRIDADKNIWSAPISTDIPNSRQLYVDGVRATRTRGRLPIALAMNESGYTAATATMSAWKHPSEMEFVYTGGNTVWSERSAGLGSWTEARCPVQSIEGTKITMVQPCWNNSTQRIMLPSGERTVNLVGPKSIGKTPTYVENAYELLGTPGQFYLDRVASTIYYVPRIGEDLTKADVELPVLESLVELRGMAANPVHNIVFSGLQFSYATWLAPNGPDGFSEIQAGYQVTGAEGYLKQGLCTLTPGGTCPYGAWTKEAANVTLHFAHNVRFTRDAFVHLGGAGLDLGDGAQNDLVEGSIFTDISGNGLELASVAAPLAADTEFASDNRIDNNLFESVGAEFRGGIGLVIGYARRTLVSHNQFDQLPYAAISIGWGGWPDKIKKAGQANRSGQNIISNNMVHNLMLVLSDGGGIYTQGRTGKSLNDGERVLNNVVYDQYSSGHAIYTDNGSSMITVSGNVMFHTNHDNWGSRHRDWYDSDGKAYDPLLIAGNYWQQGDEDVSRENVTVQGNHLINALSEAPAEIVQNAGLQPTFRDIATLRFAKNAPPEPPSRVGAWAGDGFAFVTWSPSVQEGGAPVESYIVRASNGAEVRISNAEFWKNTYVKVSGLPDGDPLTFTVSASNRYGESVDSLPSLPVKPEERKVELPSAPENVSALAGKGEVSIHFQVPPENESNKEKIPLLAYAVTINPGGRRVLFTGRNVVVLDGKHITFNVVDGLTSGASYTFHVAAVNSFGEGAAAVVGPVKVQ